MIGTVIKRGSSICVYDEKGRTLCVKTNGEIMGYTGTTFSVKKGNSIYVYNEKGITLSVKSC